MPIAWERIENLTIEEAWEELRAWKPNPEGPPEPLPPLPVPLRDFSHVRIAKLPPELLDPSMWWWLDGPEFCPGPPAAFATWFSMAPDLGPLAPGRFRTNFGPVFWRGRLDGSARLLIVGQDPSSDEQLARRCFVGRAGQRLQGLLAKVGLSRSYVIINTLHVGIVGSFDDELRAASSHPAVLAWRNGLLDKLRAQNTFQAVLTAGSAARDAVDAWPGLGSLTDKRVHVWHPTARDESALLETWNAALPRLADKITPDLGESPDLTEYGTTFTPEDHKPIPRRDLPFGIPNWHGSGGSSHSTRDGIDQSIIWTHPS